MFKRFTVTLVIIAVVAVPTTSAQSMPAQTAPNAELLVPASVVVPVVMIIDPCRPLGFLNLLGLCSSPQSPVIIEPAPSVGDDTNMHELQPRDPNLDPSETVPFHPGYCDSNGNCQFPGGRSR